MPVTKISGALLKKMVTNGAVNLKNCYAEVDALNVFPVPDGDTGTNMSMTMMAGIREIENVSTTAVRSDDVCLAQNRTLYGLRPRNHGDECRPRPHRRDRCGPDRDRRHAVPL